MEAFVFVGIYVLALALPAAVTTAIFAMLVRGFRSGKRTPSLTFVLVGTIAPIAMAVYGLAISWPWPWYQPEQVQDMIPPGPGLLIAALPAWLLCLLTSWIILRRPTDVR
jgi:hypothetical protein